MTYRLSLFALGFFSLTLAACGGNPPDDTGADTQGDTANIISSGAAEDADNTDDDMSTSMENAPEFPLGTVKEADLRRRIATMSADEFGGRAPATPGGEKTRAYLIEEMQNLGMEPAVGDSFEQSVPLVEITLDPSQSSLSVDGEAFAYGPDAVYWTKRVEDTVSFADSDLVFVGYGVVAPEYGWNDYEGIDVTGKTVVMLVNDPGFATENPDLFNGRAMTYYGRWTYKYEEAARQGAAAALIVHQTAPAAYGWGVVEGSWTGPQLDLERPDGGAGRVALEGWVQESIARDLFAKAGLNFDDVTASAQRPDFSPVPMGTLKAAGAIQNTIKRSASANVAGMIPGKTHPDEYVLYMGHWDHLGKTQGPDGDLISNGAVDNATGTAGIISIAQAFAENGEQPDRSILVVGVTAEESGLLGSAYMAEDPFVPLQNIVGGINIDAILPTPETNDIIVIGYGSSELEDLLQIAAQKRGKYLRPDAEPEKGYFYRSDHISLSKKGVPMIYADSGIDFVDGGEEAGRAFTQDYVENRYHKPADEYDPEWDMTGMVSTLTMFYEVGAMLAYSDQWPNWYEGNEFRALRDAQRADTE